MRPASAPAHPAGRSHRSTDPDRAEDRSTPPSPTSTRLRLLRFFLWLSVLAWGVGLGAKLFDLLVVASAWGASPPESLSLLPYGKRYPVDPGDFFQPLSALLLVGVVGTLAAGWRTSRADRAWMFVPALMLLVIWVLTPTIFWPMISELWAVARGRVSMSHAEVVALVQRWFVWDGLRTVLIAVGFVSSIRAIGVAVSHRDHAGLRAAD